MATQKEWAPDKATVGRRRQPDQLSVSPFVRQFVQLTRHLLSATTVRAALDQIVATTHEVVPGADLVSVTMRSSDGTFHTLAQTDDVAVELDQLQYATGEGPCVTVTRGAGMAHVRSDDLATVRFWPRFGPAAAGLGVHTALAVALLPDVQPPRYSGALNIYAYRPAGLAADAHEAALLLATHASLALADTEATMRAELTATNLRRAIANRDVIGQAKGILMQRHGISADEAFDQLRRISQSLNVKLAHLAEVVATQRAEIDIAEL